MILIKSVELYITKENSVTLARVRQVPPTSSKGDYVKLIDCEIREELINGECFKNVHGQKVVLGWSKEVGEAIGLPMTIFKDQTNHINYLERNLSELRDINEVLYERVTDFTDMSFWQRLKFLFRRKNNGA
jgi:hypothetical protein